MDEPKPRRPLPEDRRELAARYMPLALKLTGWYRQHFPSMEAEFESAAMLGLVMAARDFDPDRGVNFATGYCQMLAGRQ